MLYFPPIDDHTSPDGSSPRNPNRDPVERNDTHQHLPSLGSQLRALQDELEAQRAIVSQKDAEIQRLKDANELLRRQYEEKCDVLELRTTKFRAAEKMFVQDDGVSALEIEDTLKQLNRQIAAIAVSCSNLEISLEGFTPVKPKRNRQRPAALDDEMLLNLKNVLGDELLEFLISNDYVKGRSAIRFSMQSIMCFFVCRVCQTYPYSPTRKARSTLGDGIWDIYKDIYVNEPQAVSARWRSVGCKYRKTPGTFDTFLKEMTSYTAEYLGRVLMVAGVHPNVAKLREYCTHCVGEKVKEMWTAALRYAENLKERVFSSDYSLLDFVRPLEYDSSAMKIPVHTVGAERKLPEGKVLRTIELGLQRTTNLAKPGESTNGQLKTDIIVKSVVLMDRDLEKLMEPS